MNQTIIHKSISLLLIFALLFHFTAASAFAIEKPAVNAHGMNLNSFGSVNAGSVDLASGAFRYQATDVHIPGRNGMDLKVTRSYNSKEFLSSPKWSALDGDAYYNYAGEKLIDAEWQAALPAQYGGWIGNGWATNISGRLLKIKFENKYKKTDWFGANTVANNHKITEIVIIQVNGGSYSFERIYEKGKDAELISQKPFLPKDKGDQSQLQTTDSGFKFILNNGRAYHFYENYYNKTFDLDFSAITDLRSVETKHTVRNAVMGEYLSYINDPFGNTISYEYERGPTYRFAEQREKILTNPAQHMAILCSAIDMGQFNYVITADLLGYLKAQAVVRTAAWLQEAGNLQLDAAGSFLMSNVVNAVYNSLIYGTELHEALAQMTRGIVKQKIIEGIVWAIFQVFNVSNPVGWVAMAATFLVNLILADSQSGAVVTNLSLTPIRPIRIYDNAGQEIIISYIEPALPDPQPTFELETRTRQVYDAMAEAYIEEEYQEQVRIEYPFETESDNYSRIAQLTYAGPLGQESVNYIYNTNGLLQEVKKSGIHQTEKYNYTFYYTNSPEGETPEFPANLDTQKIAFDWDQAQAGTYDNRGALLTHVLTRTGLKMDLEYDFIHTQPLNSSLSEDEDSRFSSFVLKRRSLNGKKDALTDLTQNYDYTGYDQMMVYEPHKIQDQTNQQIAVPGIGFISFDQNDNENPEQSQRAMCFSKIILTDPQNNETENRFDKGLPIQTKNPMGHLSSNTWDFELRRLTKQETYKSGYRATKEYKNYDEYGYYSLILESGTNSADKETHIEYERSTPYLNNHLLGLIKKQWVSTQGQDYHMTENTYDPEGKGKKLTTTAVSSDGRFTTTYAYDEYGNVTSVTNPANHQTKITFFNGIVPIQTLNTDPLNKDLNFKETTFYFPASTLVKQKIDMNNIETTYTYDARYRVTNQRTESPVGWQNSEFHYTDAPNNLTVILDQTSSSARQDKKIIGKFNQFSKPYHIEVEAAGVETTHTQYDFDTLLNITQVTDTQGRSTQYAYDPIQRLTAVTHPDQTQTQIHYHDSGNKKSIEDANGNLTHYHYDIYGNLIHVTDSKGNAARYHYNGIGLLTKLTDTRQLATNFHYNDRGLLTQKEYPNHTTELFQYDSLNNLSQHTDAQSQVTTYHNYDSQNRPKTITYPNNISFTYAYDQGGFKGAVSHVAIQNNQGQNQSISYRYNPLGNLTQETRQLGDQTSSHYYEWDETGLLLRQKDSWSNKWQENQYDKLGRIKKIRYPINGSLRDIIPDIQYSPQNLMTSYHLPLADIQYQFTYDTQNDRLLTSEIKRHNQPFLTQSYVYDPVGNITNYLQNRSGIEFQQKYEYDTLYQLTQRSYQMNNQPEKQFTYAYDSAGNRTRFSHEFATQKIQYAADSHQMECLYETFRKGDAGWYEFAYNEAGNRIGKTLKRNRVTSDNSTESVTVTNTEYVWDALNHLTAVKKDDQIIEENGYDLSTGLRYKSNDRYFSYDFQEKLISERQGNTVSSYIYLGNKKVAKVENNLVYYYHHDHLGTPLAITFQQDNHDKTNHYYLDPHGNRELSEEIIGTEQPLEFTGKYLGDETGLFYFHARYYDSALGGRFLGHDPAGPDYMNPLSLNPYVYCLNNPLNKIDPDGRSPISNYLPSFKSIFREAWLMDYGRSPEQSVAKVQNDIIYSEPVQFTGSVGKAINLFKVIELGNRARKFENTDMFSHQKAAWDWGNYVGNPDVALTFRTFSEFSLQMPYYSILDLYNEHIYGIPGKYQPLTLDGPGGINDSFQDIENTVKGALSEPLYLDGELYEGE